MAAALLDEVRKVGFSMPSYVDLEVFVRVAVAVGHAGCAATSEA